MTPKSTPRWVLIGGFILAVIAGGINAVGLLSVHRQAFSHMTGNVTWVGLDLVGGDLAAAWHVLAVLLAFFVGCMLSGFTLRETSAKLGRRYGMVLALESALLFGATFAMQGGLVAGEYLAAMACGLQNAMVTSYSGALIRTTHVTGMLTDLGIALGHWMQGRPVDWRRVQLCVILMSGFFVGCVLGGLGFHSMGYAALFWPAGFAGITGVGYGVLKHLDRHKMTARVARRLRPAVPRFVLKTLTRVAAEK
jgi:uncharacterized membrane protein YoaK (UPF0700 family)